jgi:uncharacterized protein (TIGR01777 family)
MIVVLAGASGLIGTALKESLRGDGHQLRVLVRRAPGATEEIRWAPERGELDAAALDGADAVVNLCGVNVGDKRWTEPVKRELVASRVEPTRTLADAIGARRADAPAVLVNASAVGFYGSRDDDPLDETEPAGPGFLAGLCAQWEAATQPAATSHTRVARIRTGLVLAKGEGVLGRLVPLVKLGLGGPIGNGRQFWPWISMADEIAAIRFVLDHPIDGAVNLTGPDPVRQRDVVRELGRQLHRPTIFPAPRFGLRLVLGEFADDILASQRAVPHALAEAGFVHQHRTLPAALAAALG